MNSWLDDVIKAPSLHMFAFERVTKSFERRGGHEYTLLREQGTGIYLVTCDVKSEYQDERHAFVFDSDDGRLLDNRVYGSSRVLTSEDREQDVIHTRDILNSWLCSPKVKIEEVYRVVRRA